jgi:hypothetical protein
MVGIDAGEPEDLWAGELDGDGYPIDPDEVYSDNTAPHIAEGEVAGATPEESIAARYRLPEEFWGAREMFKSVRQAAWASQTHPDAVLACVLARASGAAGHEVVFDSGKGSPGTLSLFACLLAPSGIGKSEAYGAASTLVRLPSHLTDDTGYADHEIFRDGLGIGTGEGLAEAYMGTVERETGKMVMKGKGRNAQPEPEMKAVRAIVRHRAFFFVDEGETLTKMMRERQGATIGPTIRTAWSGGTLGQANASEDRFRFVPARSYSMGMVIGYQPDTAVAMLSDVGPGTPQRFLWFGAQDTEMPEEMYEWPDHLVLPPEGMTEGIIRFPLEIKRWLRAQTRGKHRGEIEVDPMDSHEPLMRCKLAALLCWLDGRWEVDRSDWVLGGMIWSVSCAIRDRLIRHRDAEQARAAERKRTERMDEVREAEVLKASVSADVERVARNLPKIAKRMMDRFDAPKRYVMKKNIGRDKSLFDAAVSHAVQRGWLTEQDGELIPFDDVDSL